jgi:hypothetical protein
VPSRDVGGLCFARTHAQSLGVSVLHLARYFFYNFGFALRAEAV